MKIVATILITVTMLLVVGKLSAFDNYVEQAATQMLVDI